MASKRELYTRSDREKRRNNANVFTIIAIVLYIAIFLIDMMLPAEYGVGKFYVGCVFLSFLISSRWTIVALAAFGLALLTIGYVWSPEGALLGTNEAAINRGFAGFVICCGSWLAIRFQASAQALERSERTLREVHGIARLGHFELAMDDSGQFQCSPECLEILGISASDRLTGAEFLGRIVHPRERHDLERRIRASLARGGAYDIEFRIVRPDGEVRHVRSAGQIDADDKGQPRRLTGTLLDVSEWRRAERAWRDSEASIRSILDAVPEALVIIDQQGMIKTFSASAEALFGYRAQEVIGADVSLLMTSPHREAHEGYIRRYLETGEKRIIGEPRRLSARKADGSSFPIELTVSEIVLGDQRTFTGFIRDLTANQRMEDELRQSHKMEAIGQLTGGIAHDFNNLLTVIVGNLDLLESRLKSKAQLALVREALETAELGAQLTERLLAFGRRQPLDPKRVDLGQFVGAFHGLLRRTLGEDIDLLVESMGSLPPVMVDPGQLQNALLNLALNARDAMLEGGTLSISVSEVEAAAGPDELPSDMAAERYLVIAVGDTGKGMSPEVRDHVLEPFFTTKEAGAGTGLGLSMVYGFVKQSNGHIRIDSDVGQGTTIRLFLPAAPDAGDIEDDTSPVRHAAGPGQGETVLVVEDDARVRRVTVSRLIELGYKVIDAASGPEALDLVKTRTDVDLLLSDFVMPGGMSGGELAAAVRALRPGIAILLTTGYAQPEQIRRGRIAGATWLAKPYRTDELAGAARDALAAGRAHIANSQTGSNR